MDTGTAGGSCPRFIDAVMAAAAGGSSDGVKPRRVFDRRVENEDVHSV